MVMMKQMREKNEALVRPLAAKIAEKAEKQYARNLSMFERAIESDEKNELRPTPTANESLWAKKLSRNQSSPALVKVRSSLDVAT